MPEPASGWYGFGNFRLDLGRHVLMRDDQPVALAPKAFDLLLLFVKNPGRAFSRQELMEALWPGTFVEEANLTFQISMLRKALGNEASAWIETIPKHGYRFTADVSASTRAAVPPEPEPPAVGSVVASAQIPDGGSSVSPVMTARTAVLVVAAVATAAAVTCFAGRGFRGTPEIDAPLRTVKFAFTPQGLRRGTDTDIDIEVAVSPDGRHISYVESAGGQLWVRDIDQEHARPVPGATSVSRAFWSPDSRFIAYAEGLDLKRIPAQGGTPTTIARLPGNFRGGAWSRDGQTIVYAASEGGLFAAPASGGSPTRILEHPHLEFPSFLELPGGRQAFLFQAVDRQPYHQIQYLVAGDTRRHTIFTPTSSNPFPAYSPSGHIVYADGSGGSLAIWALPFSLEGLRATGKPFLVAQRGTTPKLSRTGTLVYSDPPVDIFQLAWCDRSGTVISTVGAPHRYNDPALSPDDRRLAVSVTDATRDVWIHELSRPTMSRLTFEAALARAAAWSPSGEDLTYSRLADENWNLYSTRANSSGEPRLIAGTAAQEFASAWSPDNRFIVYDTWPRSRGPGAGVDLFYRERRGDGSFGDPVAFLQTGFDERTPALSRDGKYVAYVSNESGRHEVYVRSFPAGENRWRVSTNGGVAPRWRRDGKELVYLEGNNMMSASVSTQPTLSLGTPAALFTRRYLTDLTLHPQYDITSDGARFIVRERLEQGPLAVHVAHNWFEEFRGQH